MLDSSLKLLASSVGIFNVHFEHESEIESSLAMFENFEEPDMVQSLISWVSESDQSSEYMNNPSCSSWAFCSCSSLF